MRYAFAAGAAVVGTCWAVPLAGRFGWMGFLAFPLAVLAAAWYGGIGPGLLATAILTAVLAFAFGAPIGSLAVESLHDRVAIASFIMISVVESTLVGTGGATRRSLQELNATLRSSEEKYRLLFEANPEPMWLFERATNRILAANDAVVAIYGYAHDELIGMRVDALFTDESRAAALEQLARARSGPATAPRLLERWRHRTKHGEVLDVEACWSTLAWPGGGGTVMLARDVTAQARGERALRAATDELRRAKTIAEDASRTKDRFIRALSHELRTPLTPVLLAASALERSGDVSERVRDVLRMIRRNVQLESSLIDELLDVSRVRAGTLTVDVETLDPRVPIDRALDVCAGMARSAGVSIDAAFDGRHARVRADAARLEQVVGTLLRHAIRASAPTRGHVRITTSDVEPDRLRIAIADDGPSLRPDQIARLFEPFACLDDDDGQSACGAGVGIALAKMIVEACGGKLEATSGGPCGGTTFTIDLLTALPALAMPLPPQDDETKRRRILLVEDDEDTRSALASILSSVGHDVVVARNAHEALSAAGEQPIDLVISDLGLPDLSGLELMTRLRERGPIRAIALSGFGADADVRASLAAGFYAHLTKPVDVEELCATIERTP